MARGLLTVVGSGQASLKKNKSCNDLEVCWLVCVLKCLCVCVCVCVCECVCE